MLECLSRSLNIQLTCEQILQVHTWKWFRFERESDWLSQRKKGQYRNMSSVMFRSLGTSSVVLLGISSVMLYQRNLRLYGPQVRVIDTRIGTFGVFVSNLNNSMMRCLPRVSHRRDQAPHGSLSTKALGQRGGFTCSWRVGESRTSSLGQFNSSRSLVVDRWKNLPRWIVVFLCMNVF